MYSLNETSLQCSTEPLHVLEVLGNVRPGGVDVWVERLVVRLPGDRFRISALCPCESASTDRLRECGVQVHVLPMPEEILWSSLKQARELVDTLGIDILHAHLPNAHLLAGLAGRLSGRPVLTTIHGCEPTPRDIEIHRTVSSHLSMVCSHSYFLASRWGLESHQLSCEPNGVDPDVFQPRRPSGMLHRHLRLPEATPLVGFVGCPFTGDAPKMLIQAAQLLQITCPEAHVVVIGGRPAQRDLAGMVEACGLAASVHVAGCHTNLPLTYNELAVVVSASSWEALPLAILEAMASSVPVVAARAGGVPNLMEEGHTGWLFEPGDFEGIASHVAQLLGNREESRRMGERARARILTCWKLDESVARVAQLLRRLALKPRLACWGSS